MRLLLDTHFLLWAAGFPSALKPTAQDIITEPQNMCYFSLVSLWELAIKSAIGQLTLDVRRLHENLLSIGFQELPIAVPHVVAVQHMRLKTADPFDRLLLAQAQCEGILLMTQDRHLQGLPGVMEVA
jgi:PIN domain nuclease of toxin-antitoxin system